MFKSTTTVVDLAVAVLFTTLLAVPRYGYADLFLPDDAPCRDQALISPAAVATTAIGLNSTLTGYGGDEEYFAVEVPGAGILSVQLTVPGSAPVEAKLALADPSCRSSRGPSYEVLSRSISQFLATVHGPGTFFFRGAAQDPMMPLGAFKLSTGFQALDADPRDVPLKEDPDPEVIEIEPEQALFDVGSLRNGLQELCGTAEIDDHGDRFLCATEMSPGQTVTGKLGYRRGTDEDSFHVVLPLTSATAVWTVAFETFGATDTFGGLYDHHGHRLAADDDGGHGANFRIVKALLPGSYFVRVEGRSGSYSLKVSASAW